IAYYILNKTIRGYEIRAVGFNPSSSEYGGINVNRNSILAMVISGLFSGLAGGIQTAGVQYRVNNLFGFTGYGFDGISVALVGNNHPIGVILSGVLFGALQKGGPMMQIEGIPKEVVGIIQGIIILFVASNFVRVMVQKYKENKEIKAQVAKGEVK
ncbi:MAG: ABC transporter permease, partial [Lutispora sp.]|nr:ABC transporter permease [Lutispora sp.]